MKKMTLIGLAVLMTLAFAVPGIYAQQNAIPQTGNWYCPMMAQGTTQGGWHCPMNYQGQGSNGGWYCPMVSQGSSGRGGWHCARMATKGNGWRGGCW